MRAMEMPRKFRDLFGPRPAPPLAEGYARLVREARDPAWYEAAGVGDTVDGRFDVIALVFSLGVLRLQQLGRAQAEADLVDRFAEDMDASFREMGVGDLSISKAVGAAVAALGGRLTAYREALASDDALEAALVRNLYRGAEPGAVALAAAAARVRALHVRIGAAPAEALERGEW